MSYPEALLFDLDGTLVDSAAGICATAREACVLLGCEAPDDDRVRPLIGLPLAVMLRAALPGDADDALVGRCVDAYREAFDRIALPVTVVFDGVEAELRRWRASGRRLAVATSKRTDVALRVLNYAGLTDLFDVIVGGDQVANGKPAPDMAVLALRLLDAHPRDAAMVGDTSHDVLMARAAGVTVYAVAYGAQDRAMLEAAGPRAIVDRFVDLAAYLG